jgi:hypothetical protein
MELKFAAIERYNASPKDLGSTKLLSKCYESAVSNDEKQLQAAQPNPRCIVFLKPRKREEKWRLKSIT